MKKILSLIAVALLASAQTFAQNINFAKAGWDKSIATTEASGAAYSRYNNPKKSAGAFENPVLQLPAVPGQPKDIKLYFAAKGIQYDKGSIQIREPKGNVLIIDGVKEGQKVLIKTKGSEEKNGETKEYKVFSRIGTVTQGDKTITNYGELEPNKEFTVGPGTTYLCIQLKQYDRVYSIDIK